MRMRRLSIDQLVSVDLVTAEGEITQAKRGSNADLLWGVRVVDR